MYGGLERERTPLLDVGKKTPSETSSLRNQPELGRQSPHRELALLINKQEAVLICINYISS